MSIRVSNLKRWRIRVKWSRMFQRWVYDYESSIHIDQYPGMVKLAFKNALRRFNRMNGKL